MSIDNENLDTPSHQLSQDFVDDFFGRKPSTPETTNSEESDVATEESDATQEQDTQVEDDTLAPDNEDDSGDDTTPVDDQKPKKNRFQERIDEVVAKQREAERRAEALEAKLQAMSKTTETDTPDKTVDLSQSATPDPDARNEDGTDKYPLGQIDPNFIRDTVRHVALQERLEIEKVAQEAARREVVTAEQEALQANWDNGLVAAQERYPDYMTKGQALVESLAHLDKNYGEYLSNTIMQLDNGTDVFYYLAENPDEAKAITASGATKATLALGRIDAKFSKSQEVAPTLKVSNAPTPPPVVNKGSAAAVNKGFDPSTYNEAFINEFFKHR